MAKRRTRRTLLFPANLGSPAQYEQSVFPLNRVQGTSPIKQMDIFLEATLDEIFKIRQMIGNAENSQRFIHSAKKQYDELMLSKQEMEQQKKSLNPVKIFSAYRSVRLLLGAGKALYEETRTISEIMRRDLLSEVNSEDVQSVDYNDLPSDARISGIAISLDSEFQPDETMISYFTQAASFMASQVDLLGEGNPFADDHEVEDARVNVGTECVGSRINIAPEDSSTPNSLLSDSALVGSLESSLESGSYYSFQNSDVASGSTVQAPTLQI